MKNIKQEALLWVQLLAFVAIWSGVLYLSGTGLSINWEAVKKIPDAVTVYVVLAFVFTKWLWRLPVFRGWLVPFPDLQGTWHGELKSTWKDTNGTTIDPIPATLVIRQTFSSVSCALFTAESESYSAAAQISQDEESGALYLNYNYSNRPKATIRNRSAIHDGAARLRIVENPERSLEGEYWTGRCTVGDMSFRFRSKELLDTFQANARPNNVIA
jgi:hypothetical protein